jgi:hypothetical protein
MAAAAACQEVEDGLERPFERRARKADGDRPSRAFQQRGEAPNPMTELVHAFRPTIFATERSYRVESDALEWKDAQRAGRIPYGDVAKINISSMGSWFGQAQNRCVLHARSGGKTVLSSVSYQRFGVTEDRSGTYAPLVRELMTRVAGANPGAVFIAGQPWGLWLFWLILLIASVLILLAGAVLVAIGQFPLPAAAVFVIILIGIPTAWRVIRHGRPHRFDPRALPDGNLPA